MNLEILLGISVILNVFLALIAGYSVGKNEEKGK